MDNQYKGMTVNERLFLSGLMEEFDIAVKKKDVEKIITILQQVEITDQLAIKMILDKLSLGEIEGS